MRRSVPATANTSQSSPASPTTSLRTTFRFRLVVADRAAVPQLAEPFTRRQQLLDQDPHPAIAGVPAVHPAEVGHQRCLEGVDAARLMIPFSLSPRPVAVKCERNRFGRLVLARTGSPSRAAHTGHQVMRSHEGGEDGQRDLAEAGYQALNAGRDVSGHLAGRWQEKPATTKR